MRMSKKYDAFVTWASGIKIPTNKKILDQMAAWSSTLNNKVNRNTIMSWRVMETNSMFADRISDVPKSYIREILKVAVSPNIISFAGGLPNRDLFPVQELQDAANAVFNDNPKDALQYSNTEGYLPLREFISRRYKEVKGLNIEPKNILITTGSQQALDLLGKTFINEKDKVIIEKPGYLGAIQLFSIYKARFSPVTLEEDGVNIAELKKASKKRNTKLMYTVPNFQNPTGITYSNEKREEIAEVLRGKPLILIEDDPYGDLRYRGEQQSSFMNFLPEQTILLGSFSKTVVPSFRTGWIVAPDEIMEKLIVAKQASDLHTNYFTQKLLVQYLDKNDLNDHISKIKDVYGHQCLAMIDSIKRHFPEEVSYTLPEGGMFLWVTLPHGISAMDLVQKAIEKDVAFVPGNPFYVDTEETISTLRLNFSCVDEATIETGIASLGQVIKDFIANKKSNSIKKK
ncbi:MAG: PLP-dependent aminotransferase family protein [Bacteroidales bacterium]|jgi:2-aminoadipate transaminase|nr:PLP-dependent aminotransferase family protein [Bacteroidales bacterium]